MKKQSRCDQPRSCIASHRCSIPPFDWIFKAIAAPHVFEHGVDGFGSWELGCFNFPSGTPRDQKHEHL